MSACISKWAFAFDRAFLTTQFPAVLNFSRLKTGGFGTAGSDMHDAADLWTIPALPFIIGVAGDAVSDLDEPEIREVLRAVFNVLELEFPSTPKILLTTVHNRFGRLVAEAAGQREGWHVTIPVPLSRNLYLESLAPADKEWWNDFLECPGVNAVDLPPLIDPLTGKPYLDEDIRRGSEAANPVWTAHFDQAAMFVSGRSHLLLNLATSTQDAASPTALAKYKPQSEVNDVAREIIARSSILIPEEALDDMSAGPVWHLTAGTKSDSGEPLDGVLVETPAAGLELGRVRYVESVPVAAQFETFNRHLSRLQKSGRLHARVFDSNVGDASALLRYFSDGISVAQSIAQRRHHRTIWMLAALFVGAAVALEFYLHRAEFGAGRLGISLYVMLVLAGVVLYWTSLRLRWQSQAEELRAMAEAMRVQSAWWDCGLVGWRERVDLYYLRGAGGSLRQVRQAVRAIINAATVMAAIAPPIRNAHTTWIHGQIDYYTSRIASRRRFLFALEFISWESFVLSLFATIVLLCVQVFGDFTVLTRRSQNSTTNLPTPGAPQSPPQSVDASTHFAQVTGMNSLFGYPTSKLLTAIALGGSVLLLGVYSAWIWRKVKDNRVFTRLDWTIALVPPFFAIPLALGALVIGLRLGLSTQVELTKTIAISPNFLLFVSMCTSIFATLVGGCRYILEKFSWKTELHGYEDILAIFKRAKTTTAAIYSSELNPSEKESRRRELLFSLGQDALAENERWLRAHRERPVEPVLG